MTDAAAKRPLRGVEAALLIWSRVEKGSIVSEELRALGERVAPADRVLAATLCYAIVRRLSLWQWLRSLFMLPKPSKFSHAAQTAVLCGIAGLTELKNFAPAVLISSLIDWTKARDPRGARVVNAVLRRALENGAAELDRLRASDALEELCLLHGTPLWAAQQLAQDYGEDQARRLVVENGAEAALSLRLSPDAPRDLAELFAGAGFETSDSPLPDGLRVHGTPLPSLLPGYAEGWFAPQSESSLEVGCWVAELEGGSLLDMCAGRGVKTAQIAQLRPDIRIEAWELSAGRAAAGKREMERLRVSSRVTYKSGDALELVPDRAPDVVFVDAPCSGSGTWRRHPEGKWGLTPEELEQTTRLQARLLERAFALVRPGGKVVYSTCSLFARENEHVAQTALNRNAQMRELPAEGTLLESVPRPVGCALLPTGPWTDGFYLAAFEKQERR